MSYSLFHALGHYILLKVGERSSSMVECLTRDLGVVGSSPPTLLRCVLEQDTFILT